MIFKSHSSKARSSINNAGQHNERHDPFPPSFHTRWWFFNILTAFCVTLLINTPFVIIFDEKLGIFSKVPSIIVFVLFIFIPFFNDKYNMLIYRIVEGSSNIVLETFSLGDLISRCRIRYMHLLLFSSIIGVPCVCGSVIILDRAYRSWEYEQNKNNLLWSRFIEFICMKSIDEGSINDMNSLFCELNLINKPTSNELLIMKAISNAFLPILSDTITYSIPILCSQIEECIDCTIANGTNRNALILLKARLLLRSSQNGLHIASVNKADTLLMQCAKNIPLSDSSHNNLSYNDAMILSSFYLYRGVVAKLQAQYISNENTNNKDKLFCTKVSESHKHYMNALGIAKVYSLGDLNTKAENNISDLTFLLCNIVLDNKRSHFVTNHINDFAPITKVNIIDSVVNQNNIIITLNNKIASLSNAFQMKQSGVLIGTWAQAECIMGKAVYNKYGGSNLKKGTKKYNEVKEHLLRSLLLLEIAFVAFDETEVLDHPELFYLDFLLSFSSDIKNKYNTISKEARERHSHNANRS